MKLERRIKSHATVPVASMSDIAFLLIIFFMVSTTFMKEAGIKAEPPETRKGEELKDKTLGTVTIDENGETYLDGDPMPISMLGDKLKERVARKQSEDRLVVLKCHKEVKSAYYIKVIEQISGAGGTLELWVEPEGVTE